MRYKRLGLSIILLGVCGGPALGVQEFRIETGWSHVEFEVSNFVIHTVSGRFKTFSGTIAYDEADVTRSSVTVSIQAASVDTEIKKRDAHLRTKDFFDVDHFPEITFHSENIVKQGEGYLMTGPLTIKGHTQSVNVPFTFTSDNSADGKPALHASAALTINRHDFGIDYGSHFSVGKEIHITIHVQAIP